MVDMVKHYYVRQQLAGRRVHASPELYILLVPSGPGGRSPAPVLDFNGAPDPVGFFLVRDTAAPPGVCGARSPESSRRPGRCARPLVFLRGVKLPTASGGN